MDTDRSRALSIHPIEPRGGGLERQNPGDRPASLPHVPPSLTYEVYYGLREKPFSLAADPRFLYRSPSHAPAFDDLDAAIRRREGPIVLTGGIGTGKTTLCRAVLGQLDRRTFSAFVPDPFLSRNDLLKMLLIEFGVMSVDDLRSGHMREASRTDLSYPLYEFLDSLVPLEAFAVLVIDEAQNLPLPLLEEIRILSDLERREKLLQVVLVGQPELRARIKLPQLRQLDQRISVRCELSPLGRPGVGGYIEHRLTVAGGSPDRIAFAPDAVELVCDVSQGIPRVINLVCDRALHHGWLDRVTRIESPQVWRALADLDLVPGEAAGGTVEVDSPGPRALEMPAPAAPPAEPAAEVAERSHGLFESMLSPTEAARHFKDVDLSALIDLEPSRPPGDTARKEAGETEAQEAQEAPGAQGRAEVGEREPEDPEVPVRPASSPEPPAAAGRPAPPAARAPSRATSATMQGWSSPSSGGGLKRALATAAVLAALGAGSVAAVGYLAGVGPLAALAGPLPALPPPPATTIAVPIEPHPLPPVGTTNS